MTISGLDILKEGIDLPGHTMKAILNESGAVFFPASLQHSSIKIDGLSYEDDYLGNALAAIVTTTSVEIRGHRDFTAERVKNIWGTILSHPEGRALHNAVVSYQGKTIFPATI